MPPIWQQTVRPDAPPEGIRPGQLWQTAQVLHSEARVRLPAGLLFGIERKIAPERWAVRWATGYTVVSEDTLLRYAVLVRMPWEGGGARG